MDSLDLQIENFLVGVDIGGTFTDCVIIDADGNVTTAKALSTPDDFARGMIDALSAGAESLGLGVEELCQRTRLLTHGTTVGTNAVVQRRGAKVGLITTKGHNDVIHIMRGSRGFTGREINKVVHFPESKKPDPVVRISPFSQLVHPHLVQEKKVVASVMGRSRHLVSSRERR